MLVLEAPLQRTDGSSQATGVALQSLQMRLEVLAGEGAKLG
jgi:hypothetical protein